MYILERYVVNDECYNFVIRKDGDVIIWLDAEQEDINDLIGLANLGLARKDDDLMEPNYAALAAHEPTSGIEDSRDAAGLPGGDPLELPRHTEGCECPHCKPWPEEIDPLAYRTYA